MRSRPIRRLAAGAVVTAASHPATGALQAPLSASLRRSKQASVAGCGLGGARRGSAGLWTPLCTVQGAGGAVTPLPPPAPLRQIAPVWRRLRRTEVTSAARGAIVLRAPLSSPAPHSPHSPRSPPLVAAGSDVTSVELARAEPRRRRGRFSRDRRRKFRRQRTACRREANGGAVFIRC